MKKEFFAIVIPLIFFVVSFQTIDSLEVALQTAQGEGKVDILNKLYSMHHGFDPIRALEYSIRALEIANDINYSKGKVNSLNNIGIIYKNQGVFDEALEYYIESLRISTSQGYEEARAFTLNNMGTVYSLKGIHDKALIYFIESYELLKSIDSKERLPDALNNIGNAYMETGREDMALQYYSKAIAASEEGSQSKGSNPLNNIGKVYFYRHDYTRALAYFEKGYLQEEERGDVLGMSNSLMNIGSTYLELGNYEEAEKILNKALDFASDAIAYPQLQLIYESLSRLYHRQNQLHKAYDYRILYDEAKDFTYHEKSSRMMTQIDMAVELQEKEKELEKLKKDQQIQNLQLENSRIIVILAVMGCILLLATGFIILKLKKGKIRL